MSVIIPVLNEARDIGRLLGEIMNQISPEGGFEVLVIDGGSTDGTRQIVDELRAGHASLRLISNPRRLSGAGKNVGLREARGEYILFLDGHCGLPRRDYLRRVIELFRSTGAACLCRPQPLNRLTEGKWSEAISAARHSPLGHNSGSDIYRESPGFTNPQSAGAAYVRSSLREVGGYDERFDACEDVEFNHRVALAGLAAYRHPDLRVNYRPRTSLGSLFRQMVRYGRGRARLMARHPREVPWALVSATALIMAVVIAWAFGGIKMGGAIAAAVGSVGLLTIAVESIRLGGLGAKAGRIALAFVTIYAGLLAGFWRGLPDWPRFRTPISS